MPSIISILLEKTEEKRETASDALAAHVAAQPTDREVVLSFLKNCTDMQGAPLTLADNGSVVTLQ